MAVQIVHDVASTGGGRRFLRGVGFLVGSVLVIAGLIAAVVPLWIALATLKNVIDGYEMPSLDAELVSWLAISGAIMVGGIAIGLRLIRGRRRLGLYLRKFGFGDSTRTVTNALTTAVGRRVRLATLDDAMVAPLGVDRTRRRLAFWIWAFASALVVWGLFWAFGGGYDRAYAASFAIDDWRESLGAFFGAIVLLFLVLVGVSLAGGIAAFAATAYRAARRAERAATRVIDSAWAIASTASNVSAQSRRILSPRLVVVRVAAPLWQNAVQGLANVADVIVIDVSHPTDALLWEVAAMKPMFANRWVLVGARESVAALADPRAVHGVDHRAQLARELDGQQIIAYGPLPADQRRFARALRHRLHAIRTR